jgi:photosystem II stability/assembly factor-like uncharacterized protein
VLAVDSAGNIWSSTDRGRSFWRETIAPAPLSSVSLSHFGDYAVAVGARGTALYRNAAGAWRTVQTGTTKDLNAALVPHHASRSYIAGDDGTLLYTDNQGASFTLQPLPTTAKFYGIEDL